MAVPTASDLLDGLDDEQRAAAVLPDGPAQVIAPAGSGKTATLVARIGVLLGRGVPAASILVVTFNRDAASELSRRIQSALGVTPGSRDGPEVRTLHALGRLIVMDSGHAARLVADRLPLLRLARRRDQAGRRPARIASGARPAAAAFEAHEAASDATQLRQSVPWRRHRAG
jgi:superfamily I DNA/RNA helicase